MTLREFLSNLANAFRTYLDTTDKINAQNFADKVGEVFEKGKAQGGGGDSFRDLFWDTMQKNGDPTYYTYAFSYNWNDELFFPKHNLVATSCNGMFQTSKITRLKSKLDELGITLDVSRCKSLLQMFQSSEVKDVPIIDGSNATSLSYTFGSRPAVETIEKLILSNKLTTVSNAFQNAENLTHVIFEGELAITGLDLHWSTKLDAESYHSLFSILSKTTSGMTVILPPYATCKAKYDDFYGQGSFDIVVASKTNWTIAHK